MIYFTLSTDTLTVLAVIFFGCSNDLDLLYSSFWFISSTPDELLIGLSLNKIYDTLMVFFSLWLSLTIRF